MIFNLFYLRFCFGPPVCIGNSSFSIFGVVPWHGCVRNIILLHTHISYFLNTSLFTPLAVHVQHFGCVTITNRDRLTFVECCSNLPTCVIVSNISFMGGIENLYMIFPYSSKGRVKQTLIDITVILHMLNTPNLLFNGYWGPFSLAIKQPRNSRCRHHVVHKNSFIILHKTHRN
jgi:hypothetical protein